ncbi:hypothetical protein Lal_00038504 [Lupinus albus]|nr:hypothetical protein Lal_00038504 [Lupinus albus]
MARRVETQNESWLTRAVMAVFTFVRYAEFEILFFLFFLIAYLLFKDIDCSVHGLSSSGTREGCSLTPNWPQNDARLSQIEDAKLLQSWDSILCISNYCISPPLSIVPKSWRTLCVYNLDFVRLGFVSKQRLLLPDQTPWSSTVKIFIVSGPRCSFGWII